MEKQHLFVIICLIALALFKAYDGMRHRWEYKRTNIQSIIWHGLGFLLMTTVSVFVYYSFFGWAVTEWKAIMWLCVISYWMADMIYNKAIGQQLFYAGDGKGSVTEIALFWIGSKLGMNMISITMMAKLLLTVVAALLTTCI